MWVRPTPTWRLWLLLMMRAPTATDNDDHTVGADDVAPAISVDKTADQLEVFAPGEDVTFTVVIENNSVSTDPVTIDSLDRR